MLALLNPALMSFCAFEFLDSGTQIINNMLVPPIAWLWVKVSFKKGTGNLEHNGMSFWATHAVFIIPEKEAIGTNKNYEAYV